MSYKPLTGEDLKSANRGYPASNMGDRLSELVQAGVIRRQAWTDPLASSTTRILAATALTAGAQAGYTTGLAQPDYARTLSVTLALGGGSQLAGGAKVTVYGTDINGNAISEDIAVGAIAAGRVDGTKAFRTVTSVDLPARAQAGDTISVGTLAAFGLDRILYDGDTILKAQMDGVHEATRPTVTFDTSYADISKCTVTPSTAPNGSRDLVVLWIDSYSRS